MDDDGHVPDLQPVGVADVNDGEGSHDLGQRRDLPGLVAVLALQYFVVVRQQRAEGLGGHRGLVMGDGLPGSLGQQPVLPVQALAIRTQAAPLFLASPAHRTSAGVHCAAVDGPMLLQ